MIALKKKKKTEVSKFSFLNTVNLIAHAANTIARIVRWRTRKKIEVVLGENQFGFWREKEMRDASGMIGIISEWTLAIHEELYACFVDW